MRACKSNELELKLRHIQGFTAAQLSTEPVGKILAEEPAAGGIDIGEILTLITCSDEIFPEYQLLEASKAGDLELVKKIVNLHPHIVNCRDLDGERP